MNDIRKDTLKRFEALKTERAPWFEHWQDISRNVWPTTGRFLTSERNRNGQRFNKIYDSSATNAVRTLAAGMMSGMTSPARPWFKLATTDRELNQYQRVKEWLDEVGKIIHTIFHRSNTYRALHTIYQELAVYGTAASVVTIDYDTVTTRRSPLGSTASPPTGVVMWTVFTASLRRPWARRCASSG